MKPPLKPLNDGVQRVFWVGECMEVLGETMDTLLFFPPYLALCISSIWLFLTCIFYNELVHWRRRRQWHPTLVLLPGKSHGQRSLVGCSPWGRWVGHDWTTSLWHFTFMHWRRKWQPTPVFLPGESQGRGSLVGCHLWGRTESDTTEATQQQQ